MTPYSQNDPRWSHHLMGESLIDTIGRVGCAVTCYAMMADVTPDVTNQKLIAGRGYANLDLVEWSTDATIMDLAYDEENNTVSYPSIAWTDHYKSQGYPTHYFVVLDGHTIIDPLDGRTKENPYNILGYQHVHPKQTTNTPSMRYLSAFKAPTGDPIYGIVQFENPDELHAAGFTDNSRIHTLSSVQILKEVGQDPITLSFQNPVPGFEVPFTNGQIPVEEYPSLDYKTLNTTHTETVVVLQGKIDKAKLDLQ